MTDRQFEQFEHPRPVGEVFLDPARFNFRFDFATSPSLPETLPETSPEASPEAPTADVAEEDEPAAATTAEVPGDVEEEVMDYDEDDSAPSDC